MTWHHVGPWKPVVATRAFSEHRDPSKRINAVRIVRRLLGPAEEFSALGTFDGSVIVERAAGEVSARCHDEQANFLALNLMHDIITGAVR